MALLANVNRDQRRRKQPYRPLDFMPEAYKPDERIRAKAHPEFLFSQKAIDEAKRKKNGRDG